MQIAQTILEQLGGNQFIAMTGAKNLGADTDSLSFRLPSNFAKQGINYVKITLKPSDTYTVETGKIRGLDYKKLGEQEMVYADNLRRVFTSITGLDVAL